MILDLIRTVFEAIVFTGVPFILLLSIVVFIHEMGHFLVARFFDVKVEIFSIGFGKELYGWNDRYGTRWKVSALPLGGYVKFWGDEGAASTPDREKIREIQEKGGEAATCFHVKPVWQRALIVAAGPFANFLLAFVILSGLIFTFGELRVLPIIAEVKAGSVAEAAGFKPGDRVLSIDGRTIESFGDIARYVVLRDGDQMRIEIDRAGERITLEATPRKTEIVDPLGNKMTGGQLGISPARETPVYEHITYGPLQSAFRAIDRTFAIVGDTLTFLGRIVTGKGDSSQISGPLGIAKISGQAAQEGVAFYVNLIAVLSVSIGLINLFPVPMLDGGHLLYYAFEAVRGRPLGEEAQEMGFRVGLALVLFLMIFATWNDLSKSGIF
ncbi:MAG: RIP metalloprotease RseP [Alphaproteobacteria bacterium]|nr:RIP metalloprotease RseP [Alphaproteobacteria bacterium]